MALQGTGKVKDVKLGESQGRGISTLRKVFCSASLKPYKCIDCVWLLSNKSNKSRWKFDSRSYNLLAQWFWCIISCVDVILIYFLHFPTSLPFWAAQLDFYEMLCLMLFKIIIDILLIQFLVLDSQLHLLRSFCYISNTFISFYVKLTWKVTRIVNTFYRT